MGVSTLRDISKQDQQLRSISETFLFVPSSATRSPPRVSLPTRRDGLHPRGPAPPTSPHAHPANLARLQRPARIIPTKPPAAQLRPPPHPYGNGGLDNRVDCTGYSPTRLAAEIAEAERRMAETPEHEVSNCVIVMSADIIQWDNNLFTASREAGYNWNITGVNVVFLADATIWRVLETLDGVWVVWRNPGKLLSITQKGEHALMTFEHLDEAVRFVDQLIADGDDARKEKLRVDRVESLCGEAKVLCGLVPKGSLVTPAKI